MWAATHGLVPEQSVICKESVVAWKEFYHGVTLLHLTLPIACSFFQNEAEKSFHVFIAPNILTHTGCFCRPLMICKVKFIDKHNKVINNYFQKKTVGSWGGCGSHAVMLCGMLFLQCCLFLKESEHDSCEV